MPRATNSPATRKRRNRRLRLARGFRGNRKLFRQAKAAVDRGMVMATIHRKLRKRNYRKLWIVRINAAVRAEGISYSRFMEGLSKAGVELNRKALSEIAIADPDGFKVIVEQAKAALA